MQKLLPAFALIVGVVVAAVSHTAIAAVQTAPRTIDHNIGNFLLESSASVQQHPQRSMSCFQIYVPQLNEVDANYQRSYGQCIERAEKARSDVELAMQPNRTEVLDSSEAMCGLFKDCKYDGKSTKFFECHSKVAGEATRLSYRVGAVSDDILQYINLLHIYIGDNEDACTRAADNDYVESRVRVYDELSACMKGESPQSLLLGAERLEISSAANAAT